MALKKRNTFSIILLITAFVGFTTATRVSQSLNINDKEQLQMTVAYGKNKCYVNLLPSINFCSNVIHEFSFRVQYQCGASYVDNDDFFNSFNYKAQFELGNSYAVLDFGIPTQQSMFYGDNKLCFGFYEDERQHNVLVELYKAGLIQYQRMYVALNSTSAGLFAGKIDMGDYDKYQLYNSFFVQLKSSPGQSQYSAISNGNLNYGSQKLKGANIVFFSLETPYTTLPITAFTEILSIFKKLDIRYTYLYNQDHTLLIPSIESLQNITLELLVEDDTSYKITLTPKQYTKQLSSGQYKVLFQPEYTLINQITLGYTVFQPYYIGFDLLDRQIRIAQKVQDIFSQA
ncbi:transmembrane protein, putative (macronuclear) [Tetrahymena thermophila SB210]|uniref:Transmembrane protein, putative n=1 Tax=Tetrahymena thermophila (strain SB210) TaxID=312017 RepID=Q22UY2_TETTS|nr:transmembrane protein, putative [Tetrahymena thermophila SB210]EAR89166.2 transmembrane protein, putative [Tetrahymena thermophila SB210]|eukprot:XP_001009411.2 transmembrane protein, putative [Tetrahymena thermophila SB210]